MKLSDVFIGRPIYWLMILLVVIFFALMGHYKIHVRYFVTFQWSVIAVAIIVVAAMLRSYVPGERVTREPMEEPVSDQKKPTV